jgi:hypothetical protein
LHQSYPLKLETALLVSAVTPMSFGTSHRIVAFNKAAQHHILRPCSMHQCYFNRQAEAALLVSAGRPMSFVTSYSIVAFNKDAQDYRLRPCSLHQCYFNRQAENSFVGQCRHTYGFWHFTQNRGLQQGCTTLKPETLFTAPKLPSEASWKQPCWSVQ